MTKEEKFAKSLYDEANEQLKEVYKEQKQNRDELLQAIAMIILTYTVLDGLMSLKSKDKSKEYKSLSTLIKSVTQSQKGTQARVVNKILDNTVKNTFNFYSYNANLKDVRKITESNFKGKHFSKRVWENEKAVGEHLHKQVKQFLDGKINVNQIKKYIEKTFNTNAYNAKRLTETEVNRCSSNAFDRFCIETGVKKVRYNATLDGRTCPICAPDNDKVFDIDKKIELPRHPLCRCFYTIEDEDIKKPKITEEKTMSKSPEGGIIEDNRLENETQNMEHKNGNKKQTIHKTNNGATRAQKFSKYWQEGSLNESIKNFTPNYEKEEKLEKGKIIYSDKKSKIQIVYDVNGNYFRIEDLTKKGKRRYLDINGKNTSNKIENGKQKGRSKDEYEALTHFKNKDGE